MYCSPSSCSKHFLYCEQHCNFMRVLGGKQILFKKQGKIISKEEKAGVDQEETWHFQELGNVAFVFDVSPRLEAHLQFQTCWGTLSISSQ